MEKLIKELETLNENISDIKNQIKQAEIDAENNIKPLKDELDHLKEDKRKYAMKHDFSSVQALNSREKNIKFKINANWNKYSLLKEDLTKLNKQKQSLENEIQLKKDYIKRNNEILAKMNKVLKNYKKTRILKDAAIESNISYNQAKQWYDWGKQDYDKNCRYFYEKILEIKDYFKDLEAQKLKKQMDDVVNAYRKTNSLKEASKIADVSYDTVKYWYEWGSMGFGEDNIYFFNKLTDNLH